MKAMILAAGLGKRMRPLTDHMPKPLIQVHGRPLIEWHLERIARAGITDVVINISYLGHMIREYVGDGSRWGVSVVYSEEPEPLETGGAIVRAAPLLNTDQFILINADVFTDFELTSLAVYSLKPGILGRLVMVNNPSFKARGDFELADDKLQPISGAGSVGYTFAGVSKLSLEVIMQYPKLREEFPLLEVFQWAIGTQMLEGQIHRGVWQDVGTPERLKSLQEDA